MEKKEHSSTTGGVANWYNHSGNKSGSSSENWALPEYPPIPLLGIYPDDSPAYNKDTCSTMFIAALFIIARAERIQMSFNRGMDTENVIYLLY